MAKDPLDSRLRAALEAAPESVEQLRAAVLESSSRRPVRHRRRAWLAAAAAAAVVGLFGWRTWFTSGPVLFEHQPLLLSNHGEVVRLRSSDGSSLRARSVESRGAEGVHFLWISTSEEPRKGEKR